MWSLPDCRYTLKNSADKKMKYEVKKKSSWVLFCFYAIGDFLFATPGVICKNSYVRRIATAFCVKIQCLLTGQRRNWRLRPILRYVLHIPKRNHIVARCSGPKCAINLFSKNDCKGKKFLIWYTLVNVMCLTFYWAIVFYFWFKVCDSEVRLRYTFLSSVNHFNYFEKKVYIL